MVSQAPGHCKIFLALGGKSLKGSTVTVLAVGFLTGESFFVKQASRVCNSKCCGVLGDKSYRKYTVSMVVVEILSKESCLSPVQRRPLGTVVAPIVWVTLITPLSFFVSSCLQIS